MRAAAVIPARMQSSRLPGKPLLPIGGVPMILRVLERARACPQLERIIVATDSVEIQRAVQGAGGEAWMTSASHRTGSDRVAEVAEKLSEEMILNLQGDEPFAPVSTLTSLIEFGWTCPDLTVVTPMVALRDERDILNPNIVKVVTALDGRALYFSRHPIPYVKPRPEVSAAAGGRVRAERGHFKHVGMYLYRREFLLHFVSLPPTPLEISESLEQLRMLEHGYPVYVVQVAEDSISVDTPEDLELVESVVSRQAHEPAQGSPPATS